MNQPLRLIIADDHPLTRHGLRKLLSVHDDIDVVGEAADGEEAVSLWRSLSPDMALLDVRMPKLDGIEATTRIRELDREAVVVILTTIVSDGDILRALRAGAKGYLPKDVPTDDIVDCIRAVKNGGAYLPARVAARMAEHMHDETLTSREQEVLLHLARGSINRRIALDLDIGEGTVKTHLKHLLAKLNARNRTEAVAVARERGMLR